MNGFGIIEKKPSRTTPEQRPNIFCFTPKCKHPQCQPICRLYGSRILYKNLTLDNSSTLSYTSAYLNKEHMTNHTECAEMRKISKDVKSMTNLPVELRKQCLRLIEHVHEPYDLMRSVEYYRHQNSRGCYNGMRPDLYNRVRTLLSWIIRKRFGTTNEFYQTVRNQWSLAYRQYSNGGVEYLRQSYVCYDPKSAIEHDGSVSKFRCIRPSRPSDGY